MEKTVVGTECQMEYRTRLMSYREEGLLCPCRLTQGAGSRAYPRGEREAERRAGVFTGPHPQAGSRVDTPIDDLYGGG